MFAKSFLNFQWKIRIWLKAFINNITDNSNKVNCVISRICSADAQIRWKIGFHQYYCKFVNRRFIYFFNQSGLATAMSTQIDRFIFVLSTLQKMIRVAFFCSLGIEHTDAQFDFAKICIRNKPTAHTKKNTYNCIFYTNIFFGLIRHSQCHSSTLIACLSGDNINMFHWLILRMTLIPFPPYILFAHSQERLQNIDLEEATLPHTHRHTRHCSKPTFQFLLFVRLTFNMQHQKKRVCEKDYHSIKLTHGKNILKKSQCFYYTNAKVMDSIFHSF